MPEGDTVWLAALRMRAALAGRTLTHADLRVPRQANTDLCGHDVVDVIARGKHMLTRLSSDLTLHSHFLMDGSWRIGRSGAPWRGGPGHTVRAVLANEQWQALGYQLHDIAVLPTSEETTLVGHLGPDVLGPDWDARHAAANLRGDPARPIGEALLDQRNLAGLGTVYESETLFLCRISPWTPVGDVDAIDDVVATAHRLLNANRQHPEQSTTGSRRRGEEHWVYARRRLPCRRCGSAVRCARIGAAPNDRVAYWCPSCQHGPAPAVDPGPSRSSAHRRPHRGRTP
ncbi:MAG: DNA glycosylase [Pseudonocardiales bacterium]|nr:MAG: DNA glycosylase [Pseudonocardiales bacterium]